MQMTGKTIIVTGASSGIGEATARLLAQQGANVVLGARRAGLLDQHVARITADGGTAVAVAGDVEQEAYHATLVQQALDRFGRLDGAFNNAGITGDLGPIPEMDSATWHKVIGVNLTSAFYAAKHQIPAMLSAGGGSVVFTSSFVGHTIGLPGMGAYAAAKAGLIGLVQVLAAEHGPAGLRANALLPGGTLTPMAGDDPGFHAVVRAMHALKRMAAPEEIARAALFLLSDAASFITGTALLADGGNSITKL
ncbi:SDR family oxidoreductase [Oleisolibacter albus]|uniref:SDR family oxidoreductase n=1 Tax=Oleisolibacter albus TaxID=2171757 RepID=UPI000DF39954|nr:SDR family oxidoreductase [Oleisolibacter albus]